MPRHLVPFGPAAALAGALIIGWQALVGNLAAGAAALSILGMAVGVIGMLLIGVTLLFGIHEPQPAPVPVRTNAPSDTTKRSESAGGCTCNR